MIQLAKTIIMTYSLLQSHQAYTKPQQLPPKLFMVESKVLDPVRFYKETITSQDILHDLLQSEGFNSLR